MSINREALRVCSSAMALTAALFTAGMAAAQQAPSATAAPGVADPLEAQAETTGQAPEGEPADPGVSNADIVVTGSRLSNTGFTAPTPVTVLGAEQVRQRAPAAIAETLYELPKFNNAGPAQANRGSTSVGFNVLDLRGIGGVRTLVLVDNRRYTPSNTTTVFDTNLIPTGLIERTEIVTGGASAAYGSDAVSGVVNFILRDKLEGVQGTIQTGISQEGDNSERVISLAAGHRFGRLHIIAGLDYSDNNGVGYPGRGFYSRDWGQNEYGRLSLPASRAANLPASIISANVEYSNKTPGGIITSGPLRGTAFAPGGVPYAFQYGSLVGTDQMIGTGNFFYSVTGRQPLRTPLERIVGLGRVTYELGEGTEIFAEANYGRSEGTGNTAEPTQDNLIIRRDNPFLPAATAAAMDANGLTTITLGRLIEERGPYFTHNVNTLKQGTIGFKAGLGSWTLDGYASHGENKYHLDVRNVTDVPNFRASLFAVRDASGAIVCGPVATNPNLNAAQRAIVEPGCVPFNLFGDGSPSAAALDYTTNYMSNDITAKQTVAALNLAGSLFSIGSRSVSLAVGGEYRRNSAKGTGDPRSQVNANFYGNYKPIDGLIEVKEGYAEIGVPLLQDIAFAKSLDLNGAVRVTDYSTSGTVTTWKLGATYEPGDFLLARVTRSRDIRAPNISDLFTQGAGGVFTGTNPRTGGAGQAATVTRGNLALTPEIANTWTAGIVLTPGFLPGLQLSADYFEIKIRNVITTPSALDIVNQCFLNNIAAACGSLTLDPSAVLGFTAIALQPLNLNRFLARGVDLEASYRLPIAGGNLNLRALATYTANLETIDATGRSFEQAGGGIAVNGIAGQPKWRLTVNTNYTYDRFFINVQTRFFTGIKYGINFIGPEDAGYSPTLGNSISKNRYPAAAYINLAMGYDLIRDGRKSAQFFFNVDNLLNKDPPFGWIQDIATYDTIGRTFKTGFRFGF